jgi:hypothetical protein
MPLDFKGLAFFEPASGDVRFTGQNRLRGSEPAYAICHVGTEVLTTLCKAKNPDGREFMRVFHKHRDVFYEAASRKFDGGDHSPRVTIRDIIL